MKLVYIASPYAGDVQSNTEAAKSYCRAALEEGVVPIAPHLLYPQFLEDSDPAERNLGLRADWSCSPAARNCGCAARRFRLVCAGKSSLPGASASRSGRWNRQRPCREGCPYDPGQPV